MDGVRRRLRVDVGDGGGVLRLRPGPLAAFAPETNREAVIAAGVPALRLVAFAMPALAASSSSPRRCAGPATRGCRWLFTWAGFLRVRIPLAYWLT